jgi:hypothetical protein
MTISSRISAAALAVTTALSPSFAEASGPCARSLPTALIAKLMGYDCDGADKSVQPREVDPEEAARIFEEVRRSENAPPVPSTPEQAAMLQHQQQVLDAAREAVKRRKSLGPAEAFTFQ